MARTRVLGTGQITGLSAVKSLSPPSGARSAQVQAEAQNVRYTADGSAPSASNGFILYAGQPAVTIDGDLTKLRFKEETASAKLNVAYGVTSR